MAGYIYPIAIYRHVLRLAPDVVLTYQVPGRIELVYSLAAAFSGEDHSFRVNGQPYDVVKALTQSGPRAVGITSIGAVFDDPAHVGGVDAAVRAEGQPGRGGRLAVEPHPADNPAHL